MGYATPATHNKRPAAGEMCQKHVSVWVYAMLLIGDRLQWSPQASAPRRFCAKPIYQNTSSQAVFQTPISQCCGKSNMRLYPTFIQYTHKKSKRGLLVVTHFWCCLCWGITMHEVKRLFSVVRATLSAAGECGESKIKPNGASRICGWRNFLGRA